MAITAHTTRALLKVRNHGSFYCVECDSAYDTADEAWECENLDLEHDTEQQRSYEEYQEWIALMTDEEYEANFEGITALSSSGWRY